MKSPRINWKSLTIHAIMRADKMNEAQATSKFNRLYRQARQAIGAHQKEVNVTKELYGSLFYESVNTFDIGSSGNKVELNKIIDKKQLRLSITEARMENFLKEYGDQIEIQFAFENLKNGVIDQKTFNQRIKMFKKWNSKYLKAGS